ncbi:competence protein [Streptococcus sp. TATVAM-FAB35]|uniref:competence protein n=1 Tax=Streptococcus TaxID=1301 RepID=UPI003980B456
MTEWKMSELESVKELTDSDLEKTVGGNSNILTANAFDWFKKFQEKTQKHM